MNLTFFFVAYVEKFIEASLLLSTQLENFRLKPISIGDCREEREKEREKNVQEKLLIGFVAMCL